MEQRRTNTNNRNMFKNIHNNLWYFLTHGVYICGYGLLYTSRCCFDGVGGRCSSDTGREGVWGGLAGYRCDKEICEIRKV